MESLQSFIFWAVLINNTTLGAGAFLKKITKWLQLSKINTSGFYLKISEPRSVCIGAYSYVYKHTYTTYDSSVSVSLQTGMEATINFSA